MRRRFFPFLSPAFFTLFACVSDPHVVNAQCGTPIVVTPAAPYTEDFESTNGGWTTGGTASDWAWGTPAKATINSAGSGTKCWIAGGLTGSSYANGERSWLQGPCLDLTGITHPYVNFLVHWETENIFDGASLQYSTDGGLSWRTAGTKNDPVNCLNANWFNITPVNFVTGSIINPAGTIRDGWAGTIRPTAGSCQGGGGSNGWVTAKHTLPALAGEPTVIFRFVFGAGTTCNSFDGFAIDKFWVGEAPPNQASYTFSCVNATTVNFNSTSLLCPTLSWNFGDPSSGGNNTSTLNSPSHTFSGPGTYTISLTASGPDNAPSAVTQQVTILGLTPSVQTPITCNSGNNGAATVAVVPAGSYTYSWNTVPVQNTPSATGLGAGTYTITVSGSNACSSAASVSLVNPAPVTPPVTSPGSRCGPGVVNLGATGSGTVNWYSDAALTNLVNTGATYGPSISSTTTFYVTNAAGPCVSAPATVTATINALPAVPSASVTVQPTCSIPAGTIVVTAPLGANYAYSTDNGVTYQASVTFGNLVPGNYNIRVRDNSSGCVSTATLLTVNPAAGASPVPLATTPVNYCQGATAAALTAVGLNLIWYTSATGGTGSATAPTPSTMVAGNFLYYVTQTLQGFCESPRLPVTVNIFPSPAAYAGGPVVSMFPGQTLVLNGSASGNNITIQWTPSVFLSNGTIAAPTVVNLSSDQVFTMRVRSADGCVSTDTVQVNVLQNLIVPNVFSPNGDNLNDAWVITPIEKYADARVEVFNRYGQVVFSRTGYGNDWKGTYNGKPLPVGTYYYIINVPLLRQKLSGSVSILR